MGQMQCSVTMLNDVFKNLGDTTTYYQGQILYSEDKDGNPRVLFNLIDIKSLITAKEYAKVIADFAPILLAGSTGPIGEVLIETGVATAFGKYSIDAYFESAVKNDPLLIFYPAVIPGRKFSKDVLSELSKNKIFNEVSKTWESPVGTIINPVAKIATKTVKVVVKSTDNVARETKKAGEKVGKLAKKAIPRVTL